MNLEKRKVIVTESITIIAIVAIALALQCFTGNFPTDIFAFPLNAVTMVLWVVVAYIIYKNRKSSALAKSLLSMRAAWLSLGSMVAIGLYLGLQSDPNSTSWLVVVGILFALTHLLLVTMRGWRTSQYIRWRFTLLHAGLIIALGSGFWGSPDRVQLRTILSTEKPATHAYHLNGTMTNLDYALQLRELDAEYNEGGMPTHFKANIDIDNEEVTLTVNHPYDRTFGEKIYLVSIDPQGAYCVVEIVREPWQWVSLAGIVLLLAGAVMLFIRGPRHTANKPIE